MTRLAEPPVKVHHVDAAEFMHLMTVGGSSAIPPRPSLQTWVNTVGPSPVRCANDGREAVGPVMAIASEAADARAIPAHHQSIAVMFDFVNPERAGRWPGHLRWQAWFDEAGETPHDHGRRIGQRLQPRYWRLSRVLWG